MPKHSHKTLRFYAADDSKDVAISGDIYVHMVDLTSLEQKRVISRVKRGIPKMLENIPYADFGFDNISVKAIRR